MVDPRLTDIVKRERQLRRHDWEIGVLLPVGALANAVSPAIWDQSAVLDAFNYATAVLAAWTWHRHMRTARERRRAFRTIMSSSAPPSKD